jgi:hypothetical protein
MTANTNQKTKSVGDKNPTLNGEITIIVMKYLNFFIKRKSSITFYEMTANLISF